MRPAALNLNVPLDDVHATKLRRLAEQMQVHEATLARSLLVHALDELDADAGHVTEILDQIPGALDRAKLGIAQARSSETVQLVDL